MKDIDLQAFEKWWSAQETGLGTAHKFTAWNAWLARAAVEADRAQRVPDTLCDDDLSDLAHSANQEALSFGLSHDVFLRYFKEVRRRLLASTPAPAQREPDWKDMYEKEKRRSAMWVAKYEKDIGPLEYAVPVAHQEPPQPVERKPMTDEIVRLAGVVLNEMPHPMTNWQSAAKKVCEAVAAIKEQT